ncbi:hypothetical protein FUAX_06960 [Fulvitalea axinellae]|uniref:Activator of Hsp90 ATPase homolog 1-like protein n=1 Tax=Fulvitalea axinellae TaxID=1182444 RepID=A0AAU9C8F4_9BACT|nr:hypothetical protein FUAX_06960 [Fulvitalea axinellae]
MPLKLIENIKLLLSRDELCGEWSSDDWSGFMMIMGSWMRINPDGTGNYRSWGIGDEGCEHYDFTGEFEWERIGKDKISIHEKGADSPEVIQYRLAKVNGRTELTSLQPKMGTIRLEAFWNFAQIMFKQN